MQVKEIESQIKEINGKMENLRSRKADLMAKLRDAKQIEFEEMHGVKSGDKLTTKKGTVYYYDRFIITCYGDIIILCHPAKNDGTPSKSVRHLYESEFSAL